MPPVSLPLAESPAGTGAPAPAAGSPESLRVADLPSAPVDALYVHVPFCFHKCHYCDFYSITRQSDGRMARFVDRVLVEAAAWQGRTHNGPSVIPKTIFFGGGTPSLLPLEHMDRLLAGLRHCFDLSAVTEWTVEVNPATARLDYCRMMREHGVDRISMGAQSFDPADLDVLERHHCPDDVERGIELARAAGFRRINLDLIYAVPGQSLASWDRSLSEALRLGTSHLSCYGLTYEPNTPIAVRRRLGQLRGVVEEDVELYMLRHTRRVLIGAGLQPYEISNYAAPGEACRHNLLYWNGGNYLGLGPSAASHIEGWRWRNRPHLGEWESAVDAGALPAIDVEHLTPRRRAGELAMLQLRLTRGIELDEFSDRTGFDADVLYADRLADLQRLGLIEPVGRSVRLTDGGLAVADAVASEFLADID
jgi:oxygen-independent coproporphyrinogen-3 oxidase